MGLDDSEVAMSDLDPLEPCPLCRRPFGAERGKRVKWLNARGREYTVRLCSDCARNPADDRIRQEDAEARTKLGMDDLWAT